MKIENFQRLFYPKSVAVIGATKNPKKMGFHALSSLVKTFKGKIYAINPNYDEILGVRAYKSIKDLPETPDLAILAVPRDAIYDSVKELLEIGCRAFVIISAGFREAEIADGEELHKRLRELVESYNAVVIGPNTFGMVNLKADLNASFTPALSFLKKGDIALVSQSGGVCHLIAPYSMREGIGFSKIVGLGNRLNVDFYDMLEYLKDDKETKSIALYIEGIDEPKKLCEKIREVSRVKPIVAMKAGRFEKADKASKSHTGSLAGNYKLYVSALKQYGAVVAEDLVELVSFAKALAMQKPMKGDRVAVISLVAGLGMVASDYCELKGLKLTKFTEETQKQIYEILPPYTIRDNPIDLGFVANDTETCGEVIELAVSDENVDGAVINYIFSWSEEFLEVPTKAIIKASREKPLTMCLNYPPGIWDDVKEELESNGVPVFSTPEIAAKSLWALREYERRIRE